MAETKGDREWASLMELFKDVPHGLATDRDRAIFAEHKRKLAAGEIRMISHEERQAARARAGRT